jgi:hypothetical protein
MPEEETTETTETSNTETAATETTQTEEKTTTTAEKETQETAPDFADKNFEFALPEGQKVDEKAVSGLKDFVIEKKMTKEAAQSIFDYMLNARNEFDANAKIERDKEIEANRKEIKTDSELGGANYESVQKAIDKITLKFGGQEFKDAVINAGLKDNPLFVRFVRNIDVVLSEDKVLTTSQGSAPGERQLTEKQIADKFINT